MALNGQIGGYDVTLADVNLGDRVALRVWNDTAWPHAMHLHGQHFWVNSSEFGQEEKALLRIPTLCSQVKGKILYLSPIIPDCGYFIVIC